MTRLLSKHWKEGRYGFHYLPLSRSIQPTVHYEKGWYDATIFGKQIGPYQSMDDAKAAVEQHMFKILDSAMARLNDKAEAERAQ